MSQENKNEGSYIYYQNAGTIKKDKFCILKDRPCKITEVSVSKTGKHGHCTMHFSGKDIFTG